MNKTSCPKLPFPCKPFLIRMSCLSVIALILMSFSPLVVHANDNVSVTIAGFLNTGSKKYDYINIMVGTSMVSYLSKIFQNVTPFSDVEVAATRRGYWTNEAFDLVTGIGMAADFGSQYCVTGYYSVDESGSVNIRLNLYDIRSQSLILDRNYREQSLKNLFGTVDNMIKDVLFILIGNSANQGMLKVHIQSGRNRYRLLVNGNYTTVVDRETDFVSTYLVGQILKIRLIRNDDQKEVLNRTVNIARTAATEINYVPKGYVSVRSLVPGMEIWMNGSNAGMSTPDHPTLLLEGEAGNLADISVRTNGITVMRADFILKECETNVVDASSSMEPLWALDVGLGLKVPFSAGLDFTMNSGIWPGLVTGFGATVETDFLRNALFHGSRTGMRFHVSFMYDVYFLPPDRYEEGTRIQSFSIRYGADLIYRFPVPFWAGFGVTVSGKFYGDYGTSAKNWVFSTNMLGNDLLVSLTAGYDLELVRDVLSVPMELRISRYLTVPDTSVYEFGFSLGLVWWLPSFMEYRPVFQMQTNA